jgi:hypothetical protein
LKKGVFDVETVEYVERKDFKITEGGKLFYEVRAEDGSESNITVGNITDRYHA